MKRERQRNWSTKMLERTETGQRKPDKIAGQNSWVSSLQRKDPRGSPAQFKTEQNISQLNKNECKMCVSGVFIKCAGSTF